MKIDIEFIGLANAAGERVAIDLVKVNVFSARPALTDFVLDGMIGGKLLNGISA